jgi:hypothetical protein
MSLLLCAGAFCRQIDERREAARDKQPDRT